MSNLEFNGAFVEDMGVLTPGSLRLTDQSLSFKGGKSVNVSSNDINGVKWQKLGNKHGIRVGLNDGGSHRFGGLKESDFDKVKQFVNANWGKNMEQDDLVIKGWNYGAAEVKGKSIDFSWENKPIFEIPCAYVSQCNVNKTEATLEFNQNDNSQIALMEMRFHMPAEQEDEDTAEKMEEFKKAVLAYAGLEVESEQPIVLLSEILCTTPRGRYDIKVYPTSIALHGKTYDYKLPVKSINRLFLVPHKDGRRVYFVLSLNPPIRQGQTRYSYLVFEFGKDEEQDLELEWTDDQLKETYGSNLTRDMSGPLYESVSKLFKIICNLKITVPGKFVGNTGTPAINCSHKQNPGLLYPMEKGFLFIHKPPMYVRFEEISSCHFARSDGGTVTRTFDFEIDLKSGSSLMFNSVEKEENNKLFDYLNRKNIKIRNPQAASGRGGGQQDADSSDDEIDPYKNKVRAEGRQREESEDDDSTDEDYDLDKDIKKKQREKDSSEGSGSEPDDEYDSGSEEDSSGSAETEPEEEEDVKGRRKAEKKPRKEKEEKKEKKAKKTKDPNEPKRPSSAYMLWFSSNRLSLKSDGDSVADVAKKGGQAWRELGSEDKKEWEAKAAQDKARWEAEMKEYKKNGGGASSSSKASKSTKKSVGPSPSKAKSKEYISDSDDSDEEEPKKKEKKAPKEESESENEDSDAGSNGSDESD